MHSISVRRFAADGALILGGARAILLQIADPVVGAGVAQHSDFSGDPMRRLRNTLTFVYAVTLGSPHEGELVARLVDRAHDGVTGATDPGRQLWVAATLYETATTVHESLFGPLDDDSADAIFQANSALGTALQVPSDAWPADRAAFDRYWIAAVAGLEVTDAARQVARELLHPRTIPWWARLAMPLERTLTVGWLPEALRNAFGLKHRPRTFRAALGITRVLVRLTPRRLREWPSRHYLRRLERTAAG